MSRAIEQAEPRLLVVGDGERLSPFASALFAPLPVVTATDYLSGIAELATAPAQGVLVGIDPECRRTESALGALKRTAGEARVVVCCEPAYEPLSRRLLSVGADDYVIFPPEPQELERALHIPGRATRDRWLRQTAAVVDRGTEELARLTDLLPRVMSGGTELLRDVAALVATAMRAESAMVVVDGSVGAVGANHGALIDRATLVQDVVRSGARVGQIRLGPSVTGAYTQHDMQCLRQHAALIGRLLELTAQTKRWQQLAFHDDLTGLPNRRRLLTFLDELLPRAERDQVQVTVLLFDIDDFKDYNDRYGHDAGDEIIRETGRLFVSCCRKHDLVSRYGGDEFVVVFWDAEGPRSAGSQHPHEVIGVLNRFRTALSTHEFSRLGARATGCLTCSGGLARFPWQARTTTELINRADEALYEAKHAGKNRFWLVGSGDVCPG